MKRAMLGKAAQAMAADIRTAIQTQTLTVSEKAQLMNVLTEIVGSAELAEAYVEANTMDMQQENQENAITDTLYEEEETGYNEGEAYSLSNPWRNMSKESDISVRVIDDVKDATMIPRIKELRSVFTGKYARGNFGYAEVYIDGIEVKELYAHSKIESYGKIKDKKFAQQVQHIAREFSEEESMFKPLRVNKELVVNGPEAFLRNVDTEAKILETLARLLGDSDYTGTIKLYTELSPCPSCQRVIKLFNEWFPGIEVTILHSNGSQLID